MSLTASNTVEQEANVSPLLALRIIWRRKYAVIVITVISSGVLIGATIHRSQSFIATSSILIQDRAHNTTDAPNESGLVAIDSLAVRTQADIIRSPELARSLVRSLNLANEPAFAPPRPLFAWLYRKLGLMSGPARAPSAAEREESVAQTLLGMLTVANDGKSYVIDLKIKVASSDDLPPQRAAALSAELANAYADGYMKFTTNVKSRNIRQTSQFIEERLVALGERLRNAQQAVQSYRTANGLVEDRAVSSEGRAVSVVSQQLAQLNTELVAASSERVQKEASLEQIRLARNDPTQPQAAPEIIASPMIQRLREQYIDLASREASIAAIRRTETPELAALRASKRGLESEIANETAKIAASLRNGVAAARAREAALRADVAQLQAQVAAQGQSEVNLLELQNNAETAREIYSTYLKRAGLAVSEVDMQTPDAMVLSRAGVPLGPAPPSTKQLIAASIVSSAILAALLVLIHERGKSGFRTSEQLQSSLQLGALGFIPATRRIREALEFKDPHSSYSEAILSVRALLRLHTGRESQVILITSALPQEGKTIFSVSLARNAALAGQRVLLIDCDLRRPAVSRAIPHAEEVSVEETNDKVPLPTIIIRRDKLSPLHTIVLNSSKYSPQDLFSMPQMPALLDRLRRRYDLILLDAPPVLAVSDPQVLARIADTTLVVVRWQKTPRAMVVSAINALRSSGAHLTGAVITQVRFKDLSASDGAQAYVYQKYPKYLSRQKAA